MRDFGKTYWDEALLLLGGAGPQPPVRVELTCIRAPYLLGAVDHGRVDGQSHALGEVRAADCDASPGRDTG